MILETLTCFPEGSKFPRTDVKMTEFEIRNTTTTVPRAFQCSRDMDTNISASMTSLLFKGLGILRCTVKSPSGMKTRNCLRVK